MQWMKKYDMIVEHSNHNCRMLYGHVNIGEYFRHHNNIYLKTNYRAVEMKSGRILHILDDYLVMKVNVKLTVE